jgi:hypothetical protein
MAQIIAFLSIVVKVVQWSACHSTVRHEVAARHLLGIRVGQTVSERYRGHDGPDTVNQPLRSAKLLQSQLLRGAEAFLRVGWPSGVVEGATGVSTSPNLFHGIDYGIEAGQAILCD